MSDDITVEESCGNIFEDLGLPDPEWRLARADLARMLREIIRERELTKKQTITLLGLTSSELDDLARGRHEEFGIDRLMRLMLALGMDIHIQVAPRPADKARAEISVECVEAF